MRIYSNKILLRSILKAAFGINVLSMKIDHINYGYFVFFLDTCILCLLLPLRNNEQESSQIMYQPKPEELHTFTQLLHTEVSDSSLVSKFF